MDKFLEQVSSWSTKVQGGSKWSRKGVPNWFNWCRFLHSGAEGNFRCRLRPPSSPMEPRLGCQPSNTSPSPMETAASSHAAPRLALLPPAPSWHGTQPCLVRPSATAAASSSAPGKARDSLSVTGSSCSPPPTPSHQLRPSPRLQVNFQFRLDWAGSITGSAIKSRLAVGIKKPGHALSFFVHLELGYLTEDFFFSEQPSNACQTRSPYTGLHCPQSFELTAAFAAIGACWACPCLLALPGPSPSRPQRDCWA